MFDETQMVKIRCNSKNQRHYINLGFVSIKPGDIVEVPAYELMPNSSALVNCVCDYCGQEYQTTYCIYKKSTSRGKLACEQCKQLKREESFIEKFGVGSPGASPECKKRARASMLEKYGAEYALQTELGQNNFKKSMNEIYGCENPAYNKELLHKARVTAYQNGTAVSSGPERRMVKMLSFLYGEENCFPGYPVDQVSLDCLLVIDGLKIDIEYDGDYWHRNTQDYDRRRNHWLISIGFKVIRILGNPKDELPSLDRLKEEVDYILQGHDIGYIDMND